jgi:hypothetical protein
LKSKDIFILYIYRQRNKGKDEFAVEFINITIKKSACGYNNNSITERFLDGLVIPNDSHIRVLPTELDLNYQEAQICARLKEEANAALLHRLADYKKKRNYYLKRTAEIAFHFIQGKINPIKACKTIDKLINAYDYKINTRGDKLTNYQVFTELHRYVQYNVKDLTDDDIQTIHKACKTLVEKYR